MFISDHGDQIGDHGLFYKSVYPYDAHMHIPFVAKVPWLSHKGMVVDDVVSMVDMVPTLLELVGVAYKPGAGLPQALAGEGKPLSSKRH